MALKLIKCPHYRFNVLVSFIRLADRELQLQEWLSSAQSGPHNYWDSLAFDVFDVLFKDCKVHDPKWVVENEIFYDQEEEKIVVEFTNFIYEKLYYQNKPDEYYLNDPEWPQMWEGAAKVASLMRANDEQYDFDKCHALKCLNKEAASTMALKLIKCPYYRPNVLSSFENLANRELQLQEWLSKDKSRSRSYWDNFFKDLANRELQLQEWLDSDHSHRYSDFLALYVANGLFEDCRLDDPKWVAENGIFYDQEEEKIVVEFANFVFEKLYYDDMPDEYYLHDPEWPKMWSGAAKMVSLMKANNKKYEFSQCHALWHYNYITYEEWNEMFDKPVDSPKPI